ncbi:MAG: type II toxin-antitoxin system VapC family toxin [Bryobacteraceae bacterium]
MIVLDTNVISELVKPVPSPAVLEWLSSQDRESVFLTSITAAELLYGIHILPPGRRRDHLEQAMEGIVLEEFKGQVLPFDDDAARVLAVVGAERREMGRPMSQFDAMIAAICRLHDARLATRNARDFEHCGITLLDPWTQTGLC